MSIVAMRVKSGILLLLLSFCATGVAAKKPEFLPPGHLPPPVKQHPKHRPFDIQLGERPFYLINDMAPGVLQNKLRSCAKGPFRRSLFSIGHRGAPLQFPEHTRESYIAGARMGAGILECDVTFTQDRELVCRHSQCDLHTTTNILLVPELAAKCSQPFQPADPATGTPASARCCASDITLAEFKTLQGKMDSSNPLATTPEEYQGGIADWRTGLYNDTGTLMSHKESIALFKSLGVKFTPELKSPMVPMPFDGDYSQADYAQQMIDEYTAMGVKPEDVWAQSFDIADVRYWIAHAPAFGRQAVYLDSANTPADLPDTTRLEAFAAEGIHIVAPPMWALVELDANDRVVPSQYALNAKAAGLDIITWTIERSPPLRRGGGWYYQTTDMGLSRDGDMYEVLHVLAKDVGILGIFSDWPATVTYYANCMGLK